MQQTRADPAVGMATTAVLNTPMPEDMFFLLKWCHNKVIYFFFFLPPKPRLERPDSSLALAASLVVLGAGLDVTPPGALAPLTPFCQSS
jgi:hypothetical protein